MGNRRVGLVVRICNNVHEELLRKSDPHVSFLLSRKITLEKRHIRVLDGIAHGQWKWWRDGIIGRIHDELAALCLINEGLDNPAQVTSKGRQVLAQYHLACKPLFTRNYSKTLCSKAV